VTPRLQAQRTNHDNVAACASWFRLTSGAGASHTLCADNYFVNVVVFTDLYRSRTCSDDHWIASPCYSKIPPEQLVLLLMQPTDAFKVVMSKGASAVDVPAQISRSFTVDRNGAITLPLCVRSAAVIPAVWTSCKGAKSENGGGSSSTACLLRYHKQFEFLLVCKPAAAFSHVLQVQAHLCLPGVCHRSSLLSLSDDWLPAAPTIGDLDSRIETAI
jgi:hypothetical protein